MRAANIVVGAIGALWFAIFVMGRYLIRGVYLQGRCIAPNADQIDYYIIIPLIAIVLLMLTAWVGNMLRKPRFTLLPSLLIGFAILPFLLAYTGGV